MNKLKIYNSATKENVIFEPIRKDEVKIYVCGPTVYAHSHLGHARSAVTFDLLHRVLLLNGYKVTIVKNYTDIDDKILKKMKETGKTLESITKEYIHSYKEDMAKLNVLANSKEPKATESIPYMEKLIKILLAKEKAYKTSDGIYLRTSLYSKNLFGIKNENSNLSRIKENKEKENQTDFALWKFDNNEKNYAYDSVLGRGRPGWHTECSAMINKFLAYKDEPYQIDIHGGGDDLKFPHHENEAVQTELAFNQELSKYWMHNGFVTLNGDKMSKSLGNTFNVKPMLKEYHGEVLRHYLLSVSYSSNLDFNEIDLNISKMKMDSIYRKKIELLNVKPVVSGNFREKIMDTMNNNLNTPEAFALIEKELKNNNKKELKANLMFLEELLGLGISNPFEYFQFGISEDFKNEINLLIEKRNKFKIEKNFEESDKIRQDLSEKGISLLDTPNGTFWEIKTKRKEDIL